MVNMIPGQWRSGKIQVRSLGILQLDHQNQHEIYLRRTDRTLLLLALQHRDYKQHCQGTMSYLLGN
jgi:hypothetical protein